MDMDMQYLLHCETDDSHCVVFEQDLIYDKKIKLQCGSTVWFVYKMNGTEKPYRGTILEISDDGEMLYNLAQKFSSSRERKPKSGEDIESSSNSTTRKSASKTDKQKSKISDDKDKESAKAQTEARKKAAKLEEEYILGQIKGSNLGSNKSRQEAVELAVTDEMKLLETFKFLTIEGQKCLDGLVKATIELEQFLAAKSAKNEKNDGENRETRNQQKTSKRIFIDPEPPKIFLREMEDECSSPKIQKFSKDFENDSIRGSEDGDNAAGLLEIIDDEDDVEKLEVKIKSKNGIKGKIDIYQQSTSASKITVDEEDLEQTWTLKYTEKTEKTVELIKDSNIFVDKVSLECAKKASTSANVLARSLLELIFKKEALIKCTWNGGSVNGKGKGSKERSPALNFTGKQTLIAYVTAQAETLKWNFNLQSMMQSLRTKIGGFKNS